MPAIDRCEQAIINALAKEGWEVVERPLQITIQERMLYADFSAKRGDNELIVEK